MKISTFESDKTLVKVLVKSLQSSLEQALADIGTAVRNGKKREIKKAIRIYTTLMAKKQKLLIEIKENYKNEGANN